MEGEQCAGELMGAFVSIIRSILSVRPVSAFGLVVIDEGSAAMELGWCGVVLWNCLKMGVCCDVVPSATR